MLARLNCWTDKQKAIYLAVNLKGSALTVLTNLPQADVYDYQRLKEALNTRFGRNTKRNFTGHVLKPGHEDGTKDCRNWRRISKG